MEKLTRTFPSANLQVAGTVSAILIPPFSVTSSLLMWPISHRPLVLPVVLLAVASILYPPLSQSSWYLPCALYLFVPVPHVETLFQAGKDLISEFRF